MLFAHEKPFGWRGIIGFKGKLSFRQYLPAKPTKYGIKVWMAADSSNGYVVNFSAYLSREREIQRRHGLGYDGIMDISRPFVIKKTSSFLR